MEVIRLFDVVTILAFCLIGGCIVSFLRARKRKGLPYLLFFAAFYAYLAVVLDYTLIQFQSLLILRHFVPRLMLRGLDKGHGLNLVPLVALTRGDITTSFLNVVLMVPFGFGLPFITDYSMRKVVVTGMLFSVAIELLQLITGLVSKTAFRVADINDVIFNTAGVAIGYGLYVGFTRAVRGRGKAGRSQNP